MTQERAEGQECEKAAQKYVEAWKKYTEAVQECVNAEREWYEARQRYSEKHLPRFMKKWADDLINELSGGLE